MAAVHTKLCTHFPIYGETTRIDDLDIFYWDAGLRSAPVILLLHGAAIPSDTFRSLISRLANSFRVIIPDCSLYGQSNRPDHLFENLARVVDGLVESLRLSRFSMYVMDQRIPVGCRLALLHPERMECLIIQSGRE
jgi:pimeloyl-ACP methyl ester carboxylesterase